MRRGLWLATMVAAVGIAVSAAGASARAASPSLPPVTAPPALLPSGSPSPSSLPTPSGLPKIPLSYKIHTIYRAPGGALIEKTSDAVLLVPTPVDVDGTLTQNEAPDLLVQLTIDAGRATVRATILPGAPASMPLLLEAIIADPRGMSNLKVAYGFDAREATAPSTFSSTVQLIGAARITSFALDIETVGAGPTIAVIGEVYEEGPGGERRDPQRGRVTYRPVPAAAHFGLLQGSDLGIGQSGVDLTTSTPSRVEVVIEDVQGDRVERTDVRIVDLPNVLSLVLTDQQDGRKTWSYQASERVGTLDLTIRDTRAGAIVEEFAISLQDMATNAVLVQDTPTHATFQSDSPIGAVSAGSARERSIVWLDEPAYLYETDRGLGESFAFRILGLSRAEFDTGDPFLVDVDIAPGPFHVLIEDGTRTLDARITDLPGHLRVAFSTTAGTLEYEGSAPIAKILVDVVDPSGVSGRATEMHLRLDQVPTALSFAFGSNGGQARMDAHDGEIGAVRLLLTSGPALVVDEGFDGVVLQDVPDHYALAARLTGLRFVSVTTGEAPYGLELVKDPGPFLVSLQEGTRAARIEVRDLPSSLTATFDPDGKVSYAGSAPIDLITVVASDPAGLSGRATDLDMRIAEVPAALTLDFSSDDVAVLDAHGARIGSIDLLLTSGPHIDVDTGYDGFVLEDVPDHYALVARLTGLRLLSVSTAAPYAIDLRKDAGRFLARMSDGARRTEVRVHDLPDSLQASLDPAGSLTYTGSAPIGELLATIDDPAGVSGLATNLDLQVLGLPAELALDLPASGRATIDAHGASIGSIDLLLTSGPEIGVPDGYDGVVLREAGAVYALAVHLEGLRYASVTTGAPYALELRKSPGPFLVDLLQGARLTVVEVLDLPDEITVTLDPAGSASYQASAPIGRITATIADPGGVSGRATSLRLELVSLPTTLDLTFGTQSGSVGIDAGAGSIGTIDLLMTSGPEVALPDGFDGVVLQDVADHYALAARLHGLRLVRASLVAPYVLDIRIDAGPFLIDLMQGARTTLVEIDELPDSLQATLDPAGAMSYTASAGIGSVIAVLQDPAGVSGRATNLDLTLLGLPAQLDLTFAGGSSAVIDAHGASIGEIDLLLTSGPVIVIDEGFDGIILRDVTASYVLAARITGLRSANVSTTAPYRIALQKAPGPFIVHLTQGARETLVTVRDLPSSIDATLDPDGVLTYSGSTGIAALDAELSDPAGVVGRATVLRLGLRDIPTALTMDFGSSASAGIDAHGSALGLVTLLATSGPDLAVDAGYEGVVLEDTTDHYAIAARLSGLRVARVTTGAAPYTLTLQKEPGPFLIRLVQGARTTLVRVHDLPSSLSATLDPAGSLTYTASSPVGELSAEITDPAGVSGRATRATALLRDIPTALDVSWAGTGTGVTADARGATVGLLEVLLTSGPGATLPADRDGLVLADLADRYVLFGRITGLRSVAFAQGPPPSFDLRTTGGRLFQVDLAAQGASGVATTTAVIDRLPSQVAVAFSSATALRYRASAGVSSLTLDAFDPDGISGRAKALHALIASVPVSLDASWSTSGTVTLDALGGTVGLVELQLTSGPNDRIPTQYDGILLEDLADRYVVFARVTGLRRLVGTQSPMPDITLSTTGGRVFKVDLNELDGGKVQYTRATLDALPTTVRVRIADREMFYDASSAASSLVLDTNSGDRWNLHADLRDPLPAHLYFCAANDGFCNGFARSSGAGSFKIDASEHTSVNVFDCARPLNANCSRGNADEFTQVDNWRVRYFAFDADSSDTAFDGYTFNNTNGHALQGYLLRIGGSVGFEADIRPGYWSNNRHVEWSWWGADKDKSGSVNCAGSGFSIRILGIWIGVTGYVC